MDAYVYNAALYCENCAKTIEIELMGKPLHEISNSDTYPQGPYCDGGGESDFPQHCDQCGVFLENPLTTDGEDYVREQVVFCAGETSCVDEWKEYYSYLWDEEYSSICGIEFKRR